MTVPLLILALIAIPVIFIVGVYNSLSRFKVRIKEAWSQIDVQLKRRVDLIPNLIETVKGYAAHEKELFESITKARSALMSASNAKEAGAADNMLSGTLKSLFAVAEAYPDLKAQEGFISLQKELADTEDKIAAARQFYNTVVRDYNQLLVTFPSNLVAGIFKFTEVEFFDVDEQDREPVKVEF